ncbi:MAG: MBOAT family protein [Spirochaetes bacterium]|nr:MBOAT family protein [Spirochaetota bacterium]
MLIYFKYLNFFIAQINSMAQIIHQPAITWSSSAYILGISFIVFHKLSYLVDLYRGKAQSAGFLNFSLYVALFPKLVQGPIILYHELSDQLISRSRSLQDSFNGVFRFIIGLSKKVLIANTLGDVADKVFALDYNHMTPAYAWLGILCYTFQIYFDFAGYSDMAIGIARMLGFQFKENFNRPYIAKNFTEFWRRWHMSLSQWFKEYVYIPLGGNRVSVLRNYFNLWVVFLISGIWHGANWTFIIWGVYHGLFLVADKKFWLEKSKSLGGAVNAGITFFFIMIGWVLFRSENMTNAVKYLGRMFDVTSINEVSSKILFSDLIDNRGVFILILAVVISFIPDGILEYAKSIKDKLSANQFAFLKVCVMYSLFVLSYFSLVNNSFKPFIYFRF